MICSLRTFYQHVVHVYFHIAPDLIFEDLIDKSLVGGAGILQPEGHHSITVEALGGHKGSVLLVFGRHPNLVVPDKGVHEAEQSKSGRRVHQLVDLWKWKAIFWAGSVEVGVVDADPPLPVGFFVHDNFGEPIGIRGFSDEARFE